MYVNRLLLAPAGVVPNQGTQRRGESPSRGARDVLLLNPPRRGRIVPLARHGAFFPCGCWLAEEKDRLCYNLLYPVLPWAAGRRQ